MFSVAQWSQWYCDMEEVLNHQETYQRITVQMVLVREVTKSQTVILTEITSALSRWESLAESSPFRNHFSYEVFMIEWWVRTCVSSVVVAASWSVGASQWQKHECRQKDRSPWEKLESTKPENVNMTVHLSPQQQPMAKTMLVLLWDQSVFVPEWPC